MKNCTKHRHRNFSREQQKQHDFPCDHLPPKIRVDYLKHSKFMVFIFAQFQVLCLHRFAIKNSSIHVFSCKKNTEKPTYFNRKKHLGIPAFVVGEIRGVGPETTLATSRPEEWNSCCSLLLRCAASAPKEAVFCFGWDFLGLGLISHSIHQTGIL